MKKFGMGIYKCFEWRGTNKWQMKAKGYIVAADYAIAENETRKLGITVSLLKERGSLMLSSAARKAVKIEDIVLVMRQLSTLISAGIPLVQALEIMSSGSEKLKLRALILTIRDDIANGKTFAEAIAPHSYFFNPLICGLVSAGEQSGTLDKMVHEVALYLERHEYLKNRIKRALYYPITMLSIAILACLAMLIFLVPRFEKIFASFGAKLPPFTMYFVNASHFVREKWWLIILIIIGIFYAFKKLKAASVAFQRFLDAMTLRVMLFGPLIRKAIISRICSTLSITLGAGIPLIDALNRVSNVATNHYFHDAIMQTREQVSQGESIALAMRSTQMFPPMVTQMIEIGEKSGALEQMFDKVGEYYRDQVNTSVEGLTTLIEPLLIVILGVMIGVFVIAMYLPIFKLGTAIKA